MLSPGLGIGVGLVNLTLTASAETAVMTFIIATAVPPPTGVRPRSDGLTRYITYVVGELRPYLSVVLLQTVLDNHDGVPDYASTNLNQLGWLMK